MRGEFKLKLHILCEAEGMWLMRSYSSNVPVPVH